MFVDSPDFSFERTTFCRPDKQTHPPTYHQIHEAARAGNLEVLKYLVESGANINGRTNEGASPLRIAINSIGEEHPVVTYLKGLGAEDHGDVVDEYYKTDDENDMEPDDDHWKVEFFEKLREQEEKAEFIDNLNDDEEEDDDDNPEGLEGLFKAIELEIEREAAAVEKRILDEVPTIVADDDEDL